MFNILYCKHLEALMDVTYAACTPLCDPFKPYTEIFVKLVILHVRSSAKSLNAI